MSITLSTNCLVYIHNCLCLGLEKKLLVSANPTDLRFLPPTLKFLLIFCKKNKTFFVNKVSKYQSIVNLYVQFNVTSHNKQYRSPLMVFNVSKLPPRLMEVIKNKNKIKSFTDLPTLLFSEPLAETSNLFF